MDHLPTFDSPKIKEKTLNDYLNTRKNLDKKIIDAKRKLSQPIYMNFSDDKDKAQLVRWLRLNDYNIKNPPEYYLLDYQPPNIGYLYDVKIESKEKIDLEYVACVRTVHDYGGYYIFFRPDCNECLNQIPNDYFLNLEEGEKLYYTTLPASYDVKEMYNSFTDKHHAYTLLFKKKENEGNDEVNEGNDDKEMEDDYVEIDEVEEVNKDE